MREERSPRNPQLDAQITLGEIGEDLRVRPADCGHIARNFRDDEQPPPIDKVARFDLASKHLRRTTTAANFEPAMLSGRRRALELLAKTRRD